MKDTEPTIKIRTLIVLVLALLALALALMVNNAYAAQSVTIWTQYESTPPVWSISDATVEPSPQGTGTTYLTFTLTNHTTDCLRIANDTMAVYMIYPDRSVALASVLPTCQPPGALVWQLVTPPSVVGVLLAGYDTAVTIDWSGTK